MKVLLSRVLLVEDQPHAQEMLERLVRQACAQAEITACITVAHALAQLDRRCSLALIDLRLLDGSGLDVLRRLKQLHPDTPAIVTTMYSDDASIFAALQAGADGYLLKTQAPEQLLASLQSMTQGEVPLSPAIARRMMRFFRSAPGLGDPAPHGDTQEAIDIEGAGALTPRETEMLAAIGRGLSTQEAAAQMGIGYHTACGHVKAIYRKLGIGSRAQAAVEAQRRRLM